MAMAGLKRLLSSSQKWKAMSVPKEELDLSVVLVCGQSFRWSKATYHDSPGQSENCSSECPTWVGVFSHRVWFLKQVGDELLYKVFRSTASVDNVDLDLEEEKVLARYFQLHISVNNLYKEWCTKDEKFEKLTRNSYQGIRIMQQNIIETIFTFICTSNNNISRITQMVQKLCLHYGKPIVEVDGETYFDFPEVNRLEGDLVEKKLKEEKFGYRASFIRKSAEQIVRNGGTEWVNTLKDVGYEEARKELQSLHGVGRKVADCICLMSLGYHKAVPIDTHIHQVAKEYLPHLNKFKTLTDKGYSEISEYFQSVYGEYAGWAQSVLFTSRLRHLKDPVQEERSAKKRKK